MSKKAIYAGTFDPLTLGHLDVVQRAAKIFPALIVAVAAESGKNTLFTQDERLDFVRVCLRNLPNVTVKTFDGLLVDYARQQGVSVLVRGLRAFSDFEYEFQMALTNRRLSPDIETMFLMPCEKYSYVSSTNVKQIARLGGNVNNFVPPPVIAALQKKILPGVPVFGLSRKT
ncbi:MAG: pantetheine-phosphate adenylyltransferase [Kiritimatiellales bacterium]